MFYVLSSQRIRYIDAFGAMGWLDATQLNVFPALVEHEEQALIGALTPGDAVARSFRLLGADRFGVDWMRHGRRVRVALNEPRNELDALHAALTAERRQLC